MKRLLTVTLVTVALAAPAPAAADWRSRSWNVSWPRQGYARTLNLYVPATRYRVTVDVDDVRLARAGWTYLACGYGVRSSRARYAVQFGAAWTRVILTLKSGWLCGEFPAVGDVSQVVVWYWR